jgi:Cyclin, N-terminal domain
MADEATVQKTKSIDSIRLKESMNNRFENKNPVKETISKSDSKSSSDQRTGDKNHSNQEDLFKDRAISFLKSINTGSPVVVGKSAPPPEPLQLVPSDTNPNPGFIRNQEEDLEIGKVQAWVTSGVIKKSYRHCIKNRKFLPCSDRPWINLNDYPGKIIPSPIKDEMNDEFSQLHPYLDSKLTLSKLVNLREDLITKVWKTCEFDPVTLAIGLTCFDRLLNMNLVNKTNRKLYAAVCVLLAFKFIEETHLDETRGKKKVLLDQLYHMDKNDLLTARMILEAEFSVYSYLNFSIHLRYKDIRDNLNHIQARLNH